MSHGPLGRGWARMGAVVYDPFLWLGERRGMRDRRRRLLAEATGRVPSRSAQAPVSTFEHYPSTVTELVLAEPELPMRRRLEQPIRPHAPRRSVSATRRLSRCRSPMAPSTPSSRRWCCAPCPIRWQYWPRCAGCYGRTAGCCSASTYSPTPPGWLDGSVFCASPWAAFAQGCRCDRPLKDLISAALTVHRANTERWRGMPPLVGPLVVGAAGVPTDTSMRPPAADIIARSAGNSRPKVVAH